MYLKLEELPEQEPSLQVLPQSAKKLLLKALTSSYLIEQRAFSPPPPFVLQVEVNIANITS